MGTTEIRNHMLSTKTVKNDVYLTALINTQEHEIQRLQNINNELKTKLSKFNVSFILLYSIHLIVFFYN